jgi:hypothetical protein
VTNHRISHFIILQFFVPCIIITYDIAFKTSRTFDSDCTSKETAVTFTVYIFKIVASNWYVYKYASFTFLKLAEY